MRLYRAALVREEGAVVLDGVLVDRARRGVAVVVATHVALAAGLAARDLAVVVTLVALEAGGAVAVAVAVARAALQCGVLNADSVCFSRLTGG